MPSIYPSGLHIKQFKSRRGNVFNSFNESTDGQRWVSGISGGSFNLATIFIYIGWGIYHYPEELCL